MRGMPDLNKGVPFGLKALWGTSRWYHYPFEWRIMTSAYIRSAVEIRDE